MAEGGVAAALGNVDEADSWETHFQDTMLGGQVPEQLAHGGAARQGGARAGARARALGRRLRPHARPGRCRSAISAATRYRRLVHIGDRTGLELLRTLQDKCVHQDVDVFMECTITHLLKDGERVCGAFGYWRATGRFVVFKARAVVLASGGARPCYEITSNSWECTGDGQALAYEAGAELIDMEFVQFHPTGMVWPPGVAGLLVTEAVRGEGGVLKNSEGERFMERYDPERMELSTRDIVARAIYTEIKEGRGTRARRRLPRRLAPSGRDREEEAAEHVRAVPRARRGRHHGGADGGRADLPLHHGRHQGRRRDGRDKRAGALRRR